MKVKGESAAVKKAHDLQRERAHESGGAGLFSKKIQEESTTSLTHFISRGNLHLNPHKAHQRKCFLPATEDVPEENCRENRYFISWVRKNRDTSFIIILGKCIVGDMWEKLD
ncbi:hypothetical protein AVEN_142137-1 [Araneus ventricosus]|uniref:Uncharacterized protein n=1 Tax=Araneus ventricosus TaxID=182803 RepID=A0A4Y2DFA5_ARAVE|nr:hypothetical protein AVEN_142137-1 [Araneus ventricosus]